MSYLAGAALQTAVYQHLRQDPGLAELVGDAVYDALPVSAPAGIYVSLGPEDVREAGDMTGGGSVHDFVVSMLAGRDELSGFGPLKAVAAAVCAALEAAPLALEHGNLVGLWFRRARARRVENSAARRIDLTFRARVDLG